MKYVDEYRDGAVATRYLAQLRAAATRPWTLMEVCGGQTHTIVRYGIDELLAPMGITLVHGPGCPVCVTPVALIDRAIAIARRPGVILASFGDMLRVPGSEAGGGGDLQRARARGADVRIVYSPLDAVRLAEREPERQVVFFAVGFETTAPANAMAVLQAARLRLTNFSMLVAHVRVPPAMESVLRSPACKVQGFLAAGHVCTVMGTSEYRAMARRYHVPIVVTGFEPLDLLQGVLMAVRLLEAGRHDVLNQYARAVRPAGNAPARVAMDDVFTTSDRVWRGLGTIPGSGLRLREEYADFDAERRFPEATAATPEPEGCAAGLVLRGLLKPHECPMFGTHCTPSQPLGALMVSAEGACAVYYRYRSRGAAAPGALHG